MISPSDIPLKEISVYTMPTDENGLHVHSPIQMDDVVHLDWYIHPPVHLSEGRLNSILRYDDMRDVARKWTGKNDFGKFDLRIRSVKENSSYCTDLFLCHTWVPQFQYRQTFNLTMSRETFYTTARQAIADTVNAILPHFQLLRERE